MCLWPQDQVVSLLGCLYGDSAFLFLCSYSVFEGRPSSVDLGGIWRRNRPAAAAAEARARLSSGASAVAASRGPCPQGATRRTGIGSALPALKPGTGTREACFDDREGCPPEQAPPGLRVSETREFCRRCSSDLSLRGCSLRGVRVSALWLRSPRMESQA